MSDRVIRVAGLGKKYRMGARLQPYRTLRDSLSGAVLMPWKMASHALTGRPLRTPRPEFWALRDVDFEVCRGETLGIIGRNGAGKSTLLKLLSRITEPTEGEIRIRGRIASLLEVGTGFHPELSGRENVFLNGAILGMSRSEIARKFDEIVAFAEVEDFIDTQVKHYSSGMYMRLAFSVAAHLEPDILIVDEVLAVGDAAFQQKCLGKMGQVSALGRTVLFVSHNIEAVRTLCNSTILIERGKVAFNGTTEEAIRTYELSYEPNVVQQTTAGVIYESREEQKDQACYVERVELLDGDGNRLAEVGTWDPVRFRIWYRSRTRIPDSSVEFWLRSRMGAKLLVFSTQPDSDVALDLLPGLHYVDCFVPHMPLSAGEYLFGVGLAKPGVHFYFQDGESAVFEVKGREVLRSGSRPSADKALVVVPHSWSVGD